MTMIPRMTASLLTPAFATSYFEGFRASPFAGRVEVPLPSGTGFRSETLTASNAAAFVNEADRLIESVPRGRTPDTLSLPISKGCWWSSGTPARPAIESHSVSDGGHVEIIRMTIRGFESKSLRLHVGFQGRFSEARMREQVTIDGKNCQRVSVYEIKFQGSMIAGLRELLGLPPRSPMEAVALGVARMLRYDEADPDAAISERIKEGRREWSRVYTPSSVRQTVFLWGEDEISLYFHVPNERPALEPEARDLWNRAADGAARYRPIILQPKKILRQ